MAMELYFSIDNIMPVVWAMAGTAATALLWLLWPYRCRVLSIARRSQADEQALKKLTVEQVEALPEISVVVYARDNARELERLLPQILMQDYPAPFEVVVVNDGSTSEVTDVVNRLANSHKNLYLTYVPPEARNLSRKKLALSLGIKATHFENLLFTCANCHIPSKLWMVAMARHFADGKEVVIGRAIVKGLRRRKLRFDQALVLTTYLSAALKGRPYRGNGYNLGYKKSLFFSAKGFSKTLNMHNGDDDLFVHEISTDENTAVELSRNALISIDFRNPKKVYREMRYNHEFTARYLPKGSRRFFGFSTLMIWVWIAATTIGVVFSLPNWLPSCFFAATIPALWLPLTFAWRRSEKALGIRPGGALLWWMMLWRWTFSLRCRMFCASDKRRNYTWNMR